jgi:hypothetical protein
MNSFGIGESVRRVEHHHFFTARARRFVDGIAHPRLLAGLIAWLAIVAVELPRAEHAFARGEHVAVDQLAFDTAQAYVVQFYPLWFTYYQSQVASTNRLVGPAQVTALYQIVVAINTDTIYASTFIDLTDEPLVLVVPPTSATYSILTLDPYGGIFKTNLVPTPSGATFVLTGPRFTGTVPPGVTRVAIPLDHSILIFRADKFSSTGQDEQTEAEAFRKGLFTQPLCTYLGRSCPDDIPPGGEALVLPEILFSEPFKTVADALIRNDPVAFLAQLQRAVAAPNTPPMTPAEQSLSSTFDTLFARAAGDDRLASAFGAGAQAAHEAILDEYLSHRDQNSWIHFTNIGNWGANAVQRASITEFIQYGNDIGTAAYYHAFRDGRGVPLDGTNPQGYVLRFAADELPAAQRFWSVTAYTPESIELIANPDGKYEVASYTPGLQTNADGSISIYLTREIPAGVPFANWLPVPRGPFNVMLRVYGVVPGSSVANNTYVPPAIVQGP